MLIEFREIQQKNRVLVTFKIRSVASWRVNTKRISIIRRIIRSNFHSHMETPLYDHYDSPKPSATESFGPKETFLSIRSSMAVQDLVRQPKKSYDSQRPCTSVQEILRESKTLYVSSRHPTTAQDPVRQSKTL